VKIINISNHRRAILRFESQFFSTAGFDLDFDLEVAKLLTVSFFCDPELNIRATVHEHQTCTSREITTSVANERTNQTR